MKHNLLTIILFLQLLIPFGMSAQPYCDIRTFNIFDGLAANNIGAMSQAPDNLIWLGTWNGLCMYDSYLFYTFRDNVGGTDMLSTNRIISVDADIYNNVWLRTVDNYGYVFSTRTSEFTPLSPLLGKHLGIKDPHFDNIVNLANGATWLSLDDEKGIVRFAPHDDSMVTGDMMLLPGSKGLLFLGAFLDSNGNEWILTNKKAILYGKGYATKRPYQYICESNKEVWLVSADAHMMCRNGRTQKDIPLPEGTGAVRQMLKTDDGRIVLAANNGVLIYNIRTRAWQHITLACPSSPSDNCTGIYVDTHNNIWAFTDAPGITRIDRNGNRQWLTATADAALTTECQRNFIMEDEHGTLWTVPRNGTFAWFNRKTNTLVPYTLWTAPGSVLPTINNWLINDQKILWVSNQPTLTQINFKLHDFFLERIGGASMVRAVFRFSATEYVCGMANGMLAIVDVTGSTPTRYVTPTGSISPSPVAFTKGKGIYAIFRDQQNRLWIGTKGEGIYLFANGSVRQFLPDRKNRYSLSGHDIYDIAADNRGRIWVCTYGNGINMVDENRQGIRFINNNNELKYPRGKYNKIRSFAQSLSYNGEMAFATTDGLVSFSPDFTKPSAIRFFYNHHVQNDSTTLQTSDVLQVYRTQSGRVFVATLGGGLQELASQSLLTDKLKFNKVTGINEDEGNIQSMIEDNNEQLWIARESSLDCYNLRSGRVNVYGPNDFDHRIDFSESKPYHDKGTDRVTIGLNPGLLSFLPDKLTKTTYQPKIIFTRASFTGDDKPMNILHRSVLNIPYNKRSVTIYFSALDYSRDFQMHYAYRIEGRGNKWIDLGSRNYVSFNDIPHGEMTIIVKSTNTHGVWSNNETRLRVKVAPRFTETIWFALIVIALIAVIVYVILRQYSIHNQMELRIEGDRMKTKFYGDMSHQLRTPLTLIGGPVNEMLRKEKLSHHARMLLEMISRNAANMLEMVNRMLDYSNSRIMVNDGNAASFATQHNGSNITADSEDEAMTTDKPYTILVVEDNDDLRHYLYDIMKDDYNVLLAANGQEGLDTARSKIPDFILTDVTMPVMDGLEMIHLIRQDKTISHIPVIILSARASVEDMELGISYNVSSYITKPFSANYLRAQVAAVISRHKAEQHDTLEMLANSSSTQNDNTGMSNDDESKHNTIDRINNTINMTPAGNDRPAKTTEANAGRNETGNDSKHGNSTTDSEHIKENENSGSNRKTEDASPAAEKPAEGIAGEEYDSTQSEKESSDARRDLDDTVKRFIAYLEANIDNADLRIDDFTVALAMSRSVLYGKIKTAVGLTPVNFIRTIRIQHAEKMITDTDKNFTMIAYSVGFSDPKYFSKVFKKLTGMTPSEYRQSKRSDNKQS